MTIVFTVYFLVRLTHHVVYERRRSARPGRGVNRSSALPLSDMWTCLRTARTDASARICIAWRQVSLLRTVDLNQVSCT